MKGGAAVALGVPSGASPLSEAAPSPPAALADSLLGTAASGWTASGTVAAGLGKVGGDGSSLMLASASRAAGWDKVAEPRVRLLPRAWVKLPEKL